MWLSIIAIEITRLSSCCVAALMCLCQGEFSEEKKSVDSRAGKDPACIQLDIKKLVMTESRRNFTIDIGTIREGRAYEVGIQLENQSGGVFQPLSAKTSCSCLVGSIKDNEIWPGKTGLLFLKFGAKRGGAEPPSGCCESRWDLD